VAIVLAVIAVVSFGTALFEPVFRVALGYATLWFALVPGGSIRRFNLISDYSYGIYILCFPIQQTFVMLYPGITPLWLLISSFPVVLALAILSWHFIEHPALKQKAWAGDIVGSLIARWAAARDRDARTGRCAEAARDPRRQLGKRKPGPPQRWTGLEPLTLTLQGRKLSTFRTHRDRPHRHGRQRRR
jgi:peptidoglycan/LPS O-acetylase OafA/YrhL